MSQNPIIISPTIDDAIPLLLSNDFTKFTRAQIDIKTGKTLRNTYYCVTFPNDPENNSLAYQYYLQLENKVEKYFKNVISSGSTNNFSAMLFPRMIYPNSTDIPMVWNKIANWYFKLDDGSIFSIPLTNKDLTSGLQKRTFEENMLHFIYETIKLIVENKNSLQIHQDSNTDYIKWVNSANMNDKTKKMFRYLPRKIWKQLIDGRLSKFCFDNFNNWFTDIYQKNAVFSLLIPQYKYENEQDLKLLSTDFSFRKDNESNKKTIFEDGLIKTDLKIPDEIIIQKIFNLLDIKDLKNMLFVCKQWFFDIKNTPKLVRKLDSNSSILTGNVQDFLRKNKDFKPCLKILKILCKYYVECVTAESFILTEFYGGKDEMDKRLVHIITLLSGKDVFGFKDNDAHLLTINTYFEYEYPDEEVEKEVPVLLENAICMLKEKNIKVVDHVYQIDECLNYECPNEQEFEKLILDMEPSSIPIKIN
jgi:hypothetical protein